MKIFIADKAYVNLRSVMTDEEYISTSEAAELLGITRQRVLQLIDDGRLEAKKFASVYMIRRKSLVNVEDRRPGRPSTKASKRGRSK